MAHVRQQIRDAVIAELTHFKNAGYLVSARRVTSLDPDELPVILVSFLPAENSEPVTMGHAPTMARTAQLTITGIVKDDEPFLDDLLEQVASGIESVITQTHNGLAKSTFLTETVKEFSILSEIPVAGISLQFAVTYHTASNAPDISL